MTRVVITDRHARDGDAIDRITVVAVTRGVITDRHAIDRITVVAEVA